MAVRSARGRLWTQKRGNPPYFSKPTVPALFSRSTVARQTCLGSHVTPQMDSFHLSLLYLNLVLDEVKGAVHNFRDQWRSVLKFAVVSKGEDKWGMLAFANHPAESQETESGSGKAKERASSASSAAALHRHPRWGFPESAKYATDSPQSLSLSLAHLQVLVAL